MQGAKKITLQSRLDHSYLRRSFFFYFKATKIEAEKESFVKVGNDNNNDDNYDDNHEK